MKKAILTLMAMLAVVCANAESMKHLTKRVFKTATEQYIQMDKQLSDISVPRTIDKDGKFVTSGIKWWCCGFYPGSLWYIYEQTGNEQIKALAEKNTLKIDVDGLNYDHDLGFEVWCSYGNAYRVTGNKKYLPSIELAAKKLATRYNPVTKTIRSWNHNTQYRVIIDNMMNLELLMESNKLFGTEDFKQIAITHSNTTIANHFRPDYTSYHVLDYNEQTGEVRSKKTAQGYADESAWARGQAWALYGYTMMYRETGIKAYLEQAQHVGDMLIPRLPEDGIPYWDFDCPDIPNTPRDASAGAIMASAYIELAGFTTDKAQKKAYLAIAEKQLRSLASENYMAKVGENGNFILMHSTGSIPHNSEVDVPLTYADYYFLEALLRWKNK